MSIIVNLDDSVFIRPLLYIYSLNSSLNHVYNITTFLKSNHIIVRF